MALENIYDSLTEEQKAKAKECKTPEQLIALAKEEGVELTDDELEGVSGGDWNCSTYCECDGVLCRQDSNAWS